MSYDVQLYALETMNKHQKLNNENFFDHNENLVKLSEKQFFTLKSRLLTYGYKLIKECEETIEFSKTDSTITVLLTQLGVYFQSGFDTDDIFEINMTASEFTDIGEFAKYNPQDGGWEL